jgi:hypothetical protein
MKRAIWLLAALALLLGGVAQAKAGVVITFSQDGANVDASASGSLNLTALMKNQGGAGGNLEADIAYVLVGPPANPAFPDLYTGFTGPTSFGPGGPFFETTGVGPYVGIDGRGGSLAVSSGYQSGSPITASSTWDNTTISGLGLTPGTYTWTWGSAANGTADSLEVFIPSASATPEPASLTLLGLGSLGLLGYGWRRRKVAATTT